MPSECFLHQVIQSILGFILLEFDFSCFCYKCHFWVISKFFHLRDATERWDPNTQWLIKSFDILPYVLWKKELEKRKGLTLKFLFTKDTCFYYFYFSYKLKFLE